MNRRSFLSTLAAAMTLDPERALWVPGRKLISIPKPSHRMTFEIAITLHPHLHVYKVHPELSRVDYYSLRSGRLIERVFDRPSGRTA